MGSLWVLLFSLAITTVLWLSPTAHSHSAPWNVSDQQALLGLKRAITLDPNNSLANWTPSLPFCNWTGITCSFPLQRAIKLNISSIGTLSPLVGNLSALESLDISNNSIYGHIPHQLGCLSALTELSLYANHITGSIPTELGRLIHLQILRLYENQLSSTIPSSIGNLSALTDLDLSQNILTGPLPAAELGKLTHLQRFYLYENRLSGPISTFLLNCTSLIGLGFYRNQLSGHIPQELGIKLVNLKLLSLWGNKLTGKIPNSIGNCSKLEHLKLSSNLLSGIVPMELGKLLFLQRINLYNNYLVSGSNNTLAFLIALTNCSQLEHLAIAQNHLTGVLPPSIGHLSSKLSYLNLAYNKIGGSIPKEISNLTNLTFLSFNNNLLKGHIPSTIGRLHKLEILSLSKNNLYGTIPDEIGEMQSLGLLNVSWNNLSGRISNSLGRLPQLRRICLHHNQFSGEIPTNLRSIPNLELLDFSYNDLRGKIPGEVMASLQNLQFYLNLSWNSLQGPLPIEISKIVNAQAIDISNNHLDGEIPGALGNCIALEHLNLSHNKFEGLIPDALGKLQNLQGIDLSYNFLSGTIPKSLGQLKELCYVNVCYNNLTGQIVEEELFPHSNVTTLFMGNPNLCGQNKYLLPACSKQGQGKHLFLIKAILSGVGVIVFIIGSLLLGMMWNWNFLRKQFDLSNFMFERLGYQKFTYQDIFSATNGFNEINLLGSGNFGSVYKGVLRDGKIIAVKVFSFQNEEGQRSFKKECKVLGRVRHRNLIRVISTCSYHDFKVLVLQFASNGSLEKHLHLDNNEEDVFGLGLSEFLNIAIDVAHGMEYLHYDSPIQVVHCDLKPSNVLLDENMTALVTDFGVSRLINFTNSMDSLSATLTIRGSIGYIAPYGLGENVSMKGDVYSYGVLLLEMVTRKRPSDAMFVEGLTLQKWVRSAFPNMLQDVVDSRLLSNINMEQHRYLVSFIHIGLLCTSESPQERPTMRDLRRALESLRYAFMGSVATTSYVTRSISYLIHNDNTTTKVEGSDSQSSTY